MKSFQMLSRRRSPDKVDFSPADPGGSSPFAQLRRLAAFLKQESAPLDDFEGMDESMNAYREYLFRKIFTSTTHQEFLDTPAETVDWLIAVAAIDSEHFRNNRK